MLSLPDYPVRQRDFLLEISRAITARLDLSEVLKRVLHASVVMTAGRVGIVALRNREDNRFYVRAFVGLQRENIPLINEKLHEIMTGIVKSGSDYQQLNDQLSEMAHTIDETLQQSVAMPLAFAESPLGLLIVFRSYRAKVDPNDIQILRSFADQAAIAVHNAQLYEGINAERQRLSAILQHSGDGVMILDSTLKILQINRAFEYITGWKTEDAVGLQQDQVINWRNVEGRNIQDALDNGWPQLEDNEERSSDTIYVEGDLERRDGMSMSIGITYAPLLGSDKHLTSIIANVRDITHFRRAQQMQNIFISTVSHELRTPVALIKGYASTLTREDAKWNMDVVKNSLNVIEEEADRLTVLIDDLLTASKIQSERYVNLVLSEVQLDLVARNALERIGTQTANHDFAFSFQDDFPLVAGDSAKLRQVIDNLLTNAIKYSPNGGTITIGGRYNDQSVTIFVRDEGAGIPETELPFIFDRFYRVDGNLTSRTKGTGLGLYLVRAIIEAHGGTINVKSHLHHGSNFYFTLPRD